MQDPFTLPQLITTKMAV